MCYGPAFVSRDLDLWAYANDVTLDFSRPGKPTDNAFIEAFNGRLRAEYLNTLWFLTLEDARRKLENWRWDYSELIPTAINHDAVAHLRCVMEVRRAGVAMRPFQAVQQASTMAS